MSGKILEVRHLQKAFDGAPVLKDISFSVSSGEVIVIVGPSGCGASDWRARNMRCRARFPADKNNASHWCVRC